MVDPGDLALVEDCASSSLDALASTLCFLLGPPTIDKCIFTLWMYNLFKHNPDLSTSATRALLDECKLLLIEVGQILSLKVRLNCCGQAAREEIQSEGLGC